MSNQLIPGTEIHYSLLAFDQKGNERTDDPQGIDGKFSARILKDAVANPPTNIFFFSHGWKGDIDSAIDQYNRWIKAMNLLDADKVKMGPDFKPLWIGLHWPSQALGDEKFPAGGGSFGEVPTSLDGLKKQYAVELGDTPEVNACLDVIFKEQEDNAATFVMPAHVSEAYMKLAALIGYTGTGPGSAPEAESEPFDPSAIFDKARDNEDFAGGGFIGALLSPFRQLTFWTMKFRARTIGEKGMHDFIASLQTALPKCKFHLMGHSFGCIIVSSILGGKGGRTPLPRQVDSLALVQGALSLWAYADKVKDLSTVGYFNAAFRRPAVSGPIIVTRSKNDTAVGIAYPAAATVIPTNPNFEGDTDLAPKFLPLFGGIGTFGIRNLPNATDIKMLPATGDYAFQPGHIYNIKGDEFIPGHSGIDGPEVAHAIWQAALFAVAPKTAGGNA